MHEAIILDNDVHVQSIYEWSIIITSWAFITNFHAYDNFFKFWVQNFTKITLSNFIRCAIVHYNSDKATLEID